MDNHQKQLEELIRLLRLMDENELNIVFKAAEKILAGKEEESRNSY